MIAEFINGLVSFLSSLFNFVLVLYILKFILRFRFGFRFPRFRNANYGRSGLRMSSSRNKAEYEYKKFKYEQRLKFRLQKYEIRAKLKNGRKKSSFIASLPNYLRIVK